MNKRTAIELGNTLYKDLFSILLEDLKKSFQERSEDWHIGACVQIFASRLFYGMNAYRKIEDRKDCGWDVRRINSISSDTIFLNYKLYQEVLRDAKERKDTL